MSVVIRDATLITVDPDDTVLYGAALAVEGDRIAAIGPTHTVLSRFPDPETVDARGKLVMPGFANVHTHFTLIIAKGIYEDLSPPNEPPFTGGLASLPTPELTPEETVIMCRLAALEALRSGTTAVLEG